MDVQRTFSGVEVTLSSRGIGRFFSGLFLAVWLLFWAVGEVIVIWLLITGATALVTGSPPEPGREPLDPGPALTMGLFLLVWLTFWTVGGLAAGMELMRLLWSRDRLLITGDRIEVRRRTGVVARSEQIEVSELRRVYRLELRPEVIAETRSGSVELTRLGTAEQQRELVRLLGAELKLEARPALPPALPEEWREVQVPEGGSVLVKDPATRRKQAKVATAFALPICLIAAVVLAEGVRKPSVLPLGIFVGAFALAVLYGTVRLWRSRTEWLLRTGGVTEQRRTGARVRPILAAETLHLDSSRDSDGDLWYALDLRAALPADATPRERRRARRTLVGRMNNEIEPRRIGEWLAARTGIQFVDMIKEPASGADVAELTRQLEGSGAFGRWLARLIVRVRGTR